MKASVKNLRIAPRKVRMVVDTVRGKSVSQAINILAFTQKKAAKPVRMLLRSAVANAAENDDITDVDDLLIDQIMVDEGPTLKRFMPRARGRATPMHKRTSHIKIILRERGN